MRMIDLSKASAWDIGIFLESERQASIDRFTDDRETVEPEAEEDE